MSTLGEAGRVARGPAITPERDRLRDAVRQLEGVFVQQLFKAMRETVPDEGVVSGGSGEEIFTSLLDEQLAGMVPAGWTRDGIEAALLRQFRDALPAPPPGAATPTPQGTAR